MSTHLLQEEAVLPCPEPSREESRHEGGGLHLGRSAALALDLNSNPWEPGELCVLVPAAGTFALSAPPLGRVYLVPSQIVLMGRGGSHETSELWPQLIGPR